MQLWTLKSWKPSAWSLIQHLKTLLPFAKKCETHITPERKTIREDVKKHLLLHQQGIAEVSAYWG